MDISVSFSWIAIQTFPAPSTAGSVMRAEAPSWPGIVCCSQDWASSVLTAIPSPQPAYSVPSCGEATKSAPQSPGRSPRRSQTSPSSLASTWRPGSGAK